MVASVEEMKQELQALIDRVSELADQSEQALSPSWEHLASQTGRFDLVSLLISVVGLSLVMAGLFAFGYFRGQAYAIAKKTAEEVAEERLTELLRLIEARMENFDRLAARAKQPSSTPSTEGAQKATGAGELEEGETK